MAEKQAKKAKKRLKTIIITIVLIMIAGVLIFTFWGNKNNGTLPEVKYLERKAEVRTIQTTLSSSGTLEPADSYTVTASVSGDILECSFEEGDKVEKDDILYVVDSSDIENTIERAQISYDRTVRSYNKIVDSLEDLYVYSDYDGTIVAVNVEAGDEIQAGTKIAEIRDSSVMKLTVPFASADADRLTPGQKGSAIIDGSFETRECVIDEIDTFESHINGRAVKYVKVSVDNTMGGLFNVTEATVTFGDTVCLAAGRFEYNKEAIITSKASGTVLSVVSKGAQVKADDTLICSLESETLQNNFNDAKASLDDAKLAFDNTKEKLEDYTITAPITGTVIEKYNKTGDTLDATRGQTAMAIIYDLSYLQFDMALDELDISLVDVGQKVLISCDALDIRNIEGEITKVSVVGTTSYNSTTYPVTVKIYNPPAGLLAGMNVDAELVVKEAKNVLSVPASAIQRGNVVYVKDDGTKREEDTAPNGYMSVKVETGISNSDYIEIISGDINEGDSVYIPQAIHATSDFMEMFGMGGGMSGMGNMGAMPQGGLPQGGAMGANRPSGNLGGGMR